MIINGTEVSRRDVKIEVQPLDAYDAIREHVLSKLGTRPDVYVNTKGQLVYDERDGGGSHSWINEIVVASEASPEICEALNALSVIRSILYRK